MENATGGLDLQYQGYMRHESAYSQGGLCDGKDVSIVINMPPPSVDLIQQHER